MASQPGKQTIAMNILPNISMKFGQLIEYNMRNMFFLKKYHTQNVVEKLFPAPFLKNQN